MNIKPIWPIYDVVLTILTNVWLTYLISTFDVLWSQMLVSDVNIMYEILHRRQIYLTNLRRISDQVWPNSDIRSFWPLHVLVLTKVWRRLDVKHFILISDVPWRKCIYRVSGQDFPISDATMTSNLSHKYAACFWQSLIKIRRQYHR